MLMKRLSAAINMFVPLVTETINTHSKLSWCTVTAVILYGIYDKFCKPPRSLRHLPYNNVFLTCWKALTGVPTRDISRDLALPFMKNSNNIPMYCRLERLGWTVHVFGPECAKKVLASSISFPKIFDQEFAGTLTGKILEVPQILSLEGPRWKDHRMIVNPAFQCALPIQLFGQTTSRLFTFLENTYQHDDLTAPFTFDVADMLFRWSLDVLGLALLDFDFETLSKKDDNPWTMVYKKLDRDIKNPLFVLFPSLDQRYRWLFPKRQAAHDNLAKFHEMLSDIINKRRIQLKQQQQQHQHQHQHQQQHSKKNLLTLMIESESYGKSRALSDEELLNNLCIFFAAGHETTASALSFALYYLAKNPDIQSKARQEAIDILCEGEEEPSMDILPTPLQTKEMCYILQVIKETLRCNGTVTSLIQPKMVAKDDTVLMGCHLPKGTPITVNIYDLHHNPNVWTSPHVFDPSRFGPGGEAELHPHGSIAWIPFGFGTRKCIGYKFNIGEQIVLLSMMLRKYEWTLPADSIHHDHVITNNIEVMNPINMKITFTRRY
ncbi:unnamed protein product [Absidia cylindrospora]